MSETGCYACELANGSKTLLGGPIGESLHWRVEHCQGTLGVGTLIVKPKRHCLHVWDLTAEETAELGPVLRTCAGLVRTLRNPDQVYVCLWSHAGWEPGHIHFVVQPAWNSQKESFSRPGPTLQYEMFEAGEALDRAQVDAFCERARREYERLQSGAAV
jgi:ATP adenylyltransferase